MGGAPCRKMPLRCNWLSQRIPFSILVFNDLLRGPEQGSVALVPQAGVNAPGYSNLPIALARSLKQLVIEKLPSDAAFDLAVRDGTTGFTFFNIEGDQYY